ncbi:MAG: EAL domain-containing protein [Treponema sp.]|nr:EAL domain-containing protein [Treponema sp.]
MDSSESFLYVINQEYKLVTFNSVFSTLYPKAKIGDSCYKAMMNKDSPCSRCPLNDSYRSVFNLYNENIRRFYTVSKAKLVTPEQGTLNFMTGSFFPTLEKGLLHRMSFMAGYDYCVEINLTKNCYRILEHDDIEYEVEYNEEPFDKLLSRLQKTQINPNDMQNFLNFWDLKTLPERVKNATVPLSLAVREKNAVGSWDEVTVTLIPETLHCSEDQLMLALYSIKDASNISARLKHSDEIDSFTGLFTERSFVIRAKEYLASKQNSEVCIIAMDVEHFRLFNKWYGRIEGDKLLKRISVFLLEMDRMFDTVSGYSGGDDFFIIMDNIPVIIEYLMNGISGILSNFDGVEGFRMAFGACLMDSEKQDIRDGMDSASTAVERLLGNYKEKICWFNKDMLKDLEYELQIAPEIEKGLDNEEFTFFLQPKYSVSEKKIVGSEALVRWKTKDHGYVAPNEFIPIIEKNGLVTRVDMYIWEKVCSTISKWKEKGIELVPVSVNVSRIDIFSVDVPEIFKNLVIKYDIDPKYVEIEITETAFAEDTRVLKEVVQKLRHYGFTVLIDDFGSGYSSLNMLKDVQADVLKMDIKFFDLNNTNYDKGVDIIESVLNMSRKMKLSVIAEGVETEEQIQVIKNIGLNYVQGFYYYQPMSVEDYEKMMKNQ